MTFFRRSAAIILLVCLLLTGCSDPEPEMKQYNATFLSLFDTVTTIIGKAEREELFQEKAQQIHDQLLIYHKLFDIYNDYDGINNIKTINDNAGIAPVRVDSAIIELLLDCRIYYEITGGRVNVAMGSVLRLWHDARKDGEDDPLNAYVPDMEALREAALHTSFEDVIIDPVASTVYLADPQLRLDVGAVAKGWAAQRVADSLESGILLSVGGNVCSTGPKDASGTPWVVGIDDPVQDGYLHTLYVHDESVVTSGDYQRWYMVDGVLYHHLIDPDTLYPGTFWTSVSVVCEDSGLADALYTALFLMPLDEGQALLEQCGAEALWLDASGQLYYSPGFRDLIKT